MQACSHSKQNIEKKENFWEIWFKYKKAIFKTCQIYTSSHYHDAQDLMSEVMLKAYNKIKKQKKAISDPYNWFMRIIQNAYINRYNYNSRYVFLENLDEALECNRNFSRSPYKELLGQEMEKQLKLSLQKLPPYQGHLARLYFEGQSYQEICNNYGISADNIRKIIQLSRQSLEQDIQRYKANFNRPEQRQEDKLHGHIIKIPKDGNLHYRLFYNAITADRLEQKICGLKNYLDQHPHASEKRFTLANMYAANSQIEEALKEIKHLLELNYYNEELYDLKVRLLLLQDKYIEVFDTAIDANKKLPLPSSKFNVWKLQAQLRYKDAEDFLKLQIRQEPTDLICRTLLVESYQNKARVKDAFDECRNIDAYDNYHMESLPSILLGKLNFESRNSAKNYVERFYKKHPKSILASLYLLHFYISEGLTLDNERVNRLFQKIRKRYSWHPDFSLAKAFLPSLNKNKTLQRRCDDYPKCALSKHYLSQFTSQKSPLPQLNSHERCHLDSVRLIYR